MILPALAAAALLVACSPTSSAPTYSDVPAGSLQPSGQGLTPVPTGAGAESGLPTPGGTGTEAAAQTQSPQAVVRGLLGTVPVVTGTAGAWGEDAWTPRVLTPETLDENGDLVPPQPGATAAPPQDPNYRAVTALMAELNEWTLSLGDDPAIDEQASRAGYETAWEKARGSGLSVEGVLSPGNIAEGFDAQAPGAWTLVSVSSQAGKYCLVDLSLFDFDSLTPEQRKITEMILPGYALLLQDCSLVATALYAQ